MTKSAWKKVLKKQCVTVDGITATTATWIHGGEVIQLTIPEGEPPKKQLVFPLQVLYEDDHLAVIHKPAGILVSGNQFKTIANALPQNLKPSPLNDACTPQPVHRLDYPTTGILLIGKTRRSIRDLNNQFADYKIHKTYYAVTIGDMPREGEIVSDIDDKYAQSNYTVIQTVPSPRFGTLNLVLLTPQTGRRHQLRKHLSGIGNPILGDKIYGVEGLILNGKGLYLHAFSITFEHPLSGKSITLRDPFPERFGKLFGPISPTKFG